MPRRTDISKDLILALILFSLPVFAADAIDIQTSHDSARELQEKLELEQLLKKHDVSKYTFTRTSSSRSGR